MLYRLLHLIRDNLLSHSDSDEFICLRKVNLVPDENLINMREQKIQEWKDYLGDKYLLAKPVQKKVIIYGYK